MTRRDLRTMASMRWSDVTLRVQTWCREHHLPRLHGCVWDRQCRGLGCPPRILLMWGRASVWVDLWDLDVEGPARYLPRAGRDRGVRALKAGEQS